MRGVCSGRNLQKLEQDIMVINSSEALRAVSFGLLRLALPLHQDFIFN
jgi:hypothetical protein